MRVMVIGGGGAIGKALVAQLTARDDIEEVVATYHRSRPVSDTHDNGAAFWHPLDLRDGEAIASCLRSQPRLDWLINCSGLLHCPGHMPEKALEQLDLNLFRLSMQLHCEANLHLACHALRPMRASRAPRFVALSARIGSIADNRLGGWYSYRCSKAALNMALKTVAIEWQRRLPRAAVAAYHPGTTDSALSRPFQKNVASDKLFSPEFAAARLLACIERLTPELSGRFWGWDGNQIAW